ncbi:ABC transporter ATP-binding protein [Candidatus Micrarchaeota archaeon]|nr:ABC transporter ATP-binding protein [Candidatus Micrarchaeota archaeon]
MLRLENVRKHYQMGDTTVKALDGVNLEVHEGESIAIMGPSGSGKSTMLHLLGCLDRPTTGKILIDNVSVADLDEDELATVRNRKIGFVFQFFFLIPTLNVLENVELPMLFDDKDSDERREEAVRLLKRVGLGERLYHKPSELSGGQRQRVAIARALSNNPAIILADEPTGNLDSKSGKEILDLFNELNDEGHTIITVTHDASLITYANRIIYLRDGRVEKVGVIHKKKKIKSKNR